MMNRTTWYKNIILRYYYSRTPLIRKLVIPIANYPDRLCLSGKFFENSKKITVLWFLELHIRRSRKV